jgi:ribosome-associated protein
MDLETRFKDEIDIPEVLSVTDEEFEADILEIISDMGGEDISCLENEINPIVCQKVIISSFISSKQIFITANKISRYAKNCKRVAKCPSRRKNIDMEWTAIDCGNLIIHLFKTEVREYYELDKFFLTGE